MSFKGFLLKLVGQHPEQVKEQKKFEESMGELEERRRELDSLLEGIREVRNTVEDKSAALSETVSSMRPQQHDREEPEEPGEVSVSVEGVEELTPS